MRHCVPALVLATLAAGSLQAETTTFKYDALGRLTQAFKQGGPADGTLTTISHDPADNRTNYAVIVTTKTLRKGEKLFSPDNRFYLTLQTNGQLALVTAATSATFWTSGTATLSTADRASFNSDGNLAILTSANASLWSSATQGNPAAQLALQNDGNLTIKSTAGTQLWQSNTGGR